MGMNDGGIKRGDRAETGDLEAQETDTVDEKGSGAGAVVTGQGSALAGGPGRSAKTKIDTLKDSTLSPNETPSDR